MPRPLIVIGLTFLVVGLAYEARSVVTALLASVVLWLVLWRLNR